MQCPQCPYAARRKDHLKRHLATKHGRGRPYPCTSCTKAFTRSDHLFRHTLAVHRRTLAFPCPHCTKAFARSDHLRTHREFVHDEGDHACDTCLGRRHSRIPLDGIHVCKACYRKATGKNSRVELQWATYLAQHFSVPPMGADQSLQALGGCSKRRPDLVYTGPGLAVCCECDEHWHRDKDRSCEEARMSELAEELGGKVVFLRFNPHGKGPPLQERFDRFRRALETICASPPDHPVSVQYLFYPPHAHNVATRWPAAHVL